MKKLIIIAAVAGFAVATPALAKHHAMHKGGGHPATVKVDGKDVPVCAGDVKDGCVNPREAGLNWGNKARKDWPGHPASEGKK